MKIICLRVNVCINASVSISMFISITNSYIYFIYVYNVLVSIFARFNIYFFPKGKTLCLVRTLWVSKNIFSLCVSLRLQFLQVKYKSVSGLFLELANKGPLRSTSLSCRMHLCGCQPKLGALCNVIVVSQLSCSL